MNTKEKKLYKLVEQAAFDTADVLSSLKDIPQMVDRNTDEWQETCRDMPNMIKRGLLKVAVVGVIKSGKSTFVNSFLGKERVKRGAGVVTSITTRIRKANRNQAHLYLKSWDEINGQIQNSLSLFPEEDAVSGMIAKFDLRRKNDRDFLKAAYDKLINEIPGASDGVRPESVLIHNVLKGYEALKDIIKPDSDVLTFSGKDFENHKTFTGDPAKAFFIKDVLLEVFSKTLDPNVELADCQGSDSTDPAQFFQIIDYLKSANLIVYCISSRTGLRQSDMSFLKVIKNLGLSENILFVNNCDLSDHEHINDLEKIEKKIESDLNFLQFDPKVYSFSALYTLFEKMESSLLVRDLKRFKFWQSEKKMVQYCDSNSDRFNRIFHHILGKKQFDLIISNQMERLLMMSSAIEEKSNLVLDLLSSDVEKTDQAIQYINDLQQNTSRLESIVANSLDGAVKGLIKEINSTIDQASYQVKPQILEKIKSFVSQTPMGFNQYRSVVSHKGFNYILYCMFQDFRLKLDLFLVKEILPEFKTFADIQEKRIEAYFQSLSDSYQIDLIKAYNSINDDVADFTKPMSDKKDPFITKLDLNNIKKIIGLDLPSQIISTQYTAKMKASAMTGFGVQTFVRIVSSVFNSRKGFSFSPGLEAAAVRIKKQVLNNISQQLEAYQSGLKKNYFSPLIEAVKRDFNEKLCERFEVYDTVANQFEETAALKQSEKEKQRQKIKAAKKQIQGIVYRLKTSRKLFDDSLENC